MTIDDYIVNHVDDEPDYLTAVNRRTWVRQINPRMCSGYLQGRVLSMLGKMINPLHILEIGTFTGYSALCLAESLADGGYVDTIEIDDELEDFIRENIALSPFDDKIKLHIGDALLVIPTLQKEYDLVFIDANKNQYIQYYDAIFPVLRHGGYILVDNTLWNGKVVEEVAPNDKQTKEIIRFNTKIKADKRVEKLILPIRDGLTILRKL
ncbi:MAG: O-methyltransferase [Paludibacteraceae bacterium]